MSAPLLNGVVIRVRDLAAEERFWGEGVRLRRLRPNPGDPSFGSAANYDLGGVFLEILKRDIVAGKPAARDEAPQAFSLLVHDLESAVSRAESAGGVAISGRHGESMGRYAYVRSPGGHCAVFVQGDDTGYRAMLGLPARS